MTGLPSVHEYLAAFEAILPDAAAAHLAMLRAHAAAPGGVMTASKLAESAGYGSYSAANMQYGVLAHRMCDFLSFSPGIGRSKSPTYTYVLARPTKPTQDDWEWTMHAPVIAALALYDQRFSGPASAFEQPVYADEVPTGDAYWEGAVVQRLVNAHERSPAARHACLEYWGTDCSVCDMDAADVYGVDASRFVHVHHLLPLASLSEPMATDPKEHLRPVCPSCHVVLHMTDPPTSILELRSRLRLMRRG